MSRKPLQIAAVIVLLAAAGFLAVRFFPGEGATARRHALARRALAMHIMAECLSTNKVCKQAVVIANPFTKKGGQATDIYAFNEAGIRGLREGFSRNVELKAVEYPDLKPEWLKNPDAVFIDPLTTTPLSFIVAEESWDQIVNRHGQAEVLVSLIGLPARLDRLQFYKQWPQKKNPRLALLLPDLRFLGNRAAIVGAFKSGFLVAAIFNKPGAPAEGQSLLKDPIDDFNRSFLLVRPDNVENILRQYPQLF